MNKEKLKTFVREVAELRRILARGDDIEEGTLTVELSNNDLAAIVYALSQCWLTEYVSAVKGYERILDLVGDVSSAILVADAAVNMDKGLSALLGGKENPEAEGDGA